MFKDQKGVPRPDGRVHGQLLFHQQPYATTGGGLFTNMVPAAEGDYPAEGTGTVGGCAWGLMAEKNGKRFDSIRFIAYLCTFKPTKKKNEELLR